jgi:hypothetical protein
LGECPDLNVESQEFGPGVQNSDFRTISKVLYGKGEKKFSELEFLQKHILLDNNFFPILEIL